MNVENATKFSCGCKMATVDDALMFEPCSATCDIHAYFIEEARRQNKPVPILDLRGEPGQLPFSTHCPYCGTKNDSYTSNHHRNRPEPGDMSICTTCLKAGFYTENGIRKPTPIEQVEIDNNAEVQSVIEAARRLFPRSAG